MSNNRSRLAGPGAQRARIAAATWLAALVGAPSVGLAQAVLSGSPQLNGILPDDFQPESGDFDPLDLYTRCILDSADAEPCGTAQSLEDVDVPWSDNPSGMDIDRIWLFYNPAEDELYVGYQTLYDSLLGHYAIGGDLDGNGDPGSVSPDAEDAGVFDPPNFDGYESFALAIALDTDGIGASGGEFTGWPDYVVGVPALDPFTQSQMGSGPKVPDFYTVTDYLAGKQLHSAFQSSEAIPQCVGIPPISPSVSRPHVEFSVKNVSQLPLFNGAFDPRKDALGIFIGSYMGATEDSGGIGEDKLPAQIDDRKPPNNQSFDDIELAWVSFPSPAGSIEALVTVNWNETLYHGDQVVDGPLPDVTVRANGGFTRSGPTTISHVTDAAGAVLWETVRMASYTLTVVPPFGYEVDTDAGYTATLDVSVGVQEAVDDPRFQLTPSDLDQDNILDLVEADLAPDNGGDTDGDGDPDWLDTDSDGDGIGDGSEVGSDLMVPVDTDADGIPDYLDSDSDDDGYPDAQEGGADTNGDGLIDRPDDTDEDDLPDYLDPDSDNDGIHDGTEVGIDVPASADTNIDSPNFAPDLDPDTQTDPDDQDTDDDCVPDGVEDASHDGNQDAGETDPLDVDSDDDDIQDGTELGYDTVGPDTDALVCQPDSDPDTTTDPLDDDTDDGTLPDGDEDLDHDGEIDPGETDPNDPTDDIDGDHDGLTDVEEGIVGTDPDDPDTDDDGVIDGQDGVEDTDDDGFIDALDPDSDNDGVQDGTESGLTEDDVTEFTDPDVFIPDEDPTTTTDPKDDDTDDDGLIEGSEDENHDGAVDPDETDPNDLDSDDDDLQDGTEEGLTEPEGDSTQPGTFEPDQDPDTTTDSLDDDSDDDGLTDGTEDDDHDGAVDPNETDPGVVDSDGDGLQDGTESGQTDPEGDDTDETVFEPDTDPSSTTDPLDDDTDDDGLTDGEEDANEDGAVSPGETDPANPDTDGDGLQDGTELGATAPSGDDTNPDTFQPDQDPSTTTDPLDDDSDDDGLTDGAEDANLDGVKGEDETDPADVDTDDDCVQDGTELGLTDPQGEDTDGDVFVADVDPSTTTDPLNPDTDGDGTPDGNGGADLNCDGRFDTGIAMGGGGMKGCDTTAGGGVDAAALALLGLAVAMRRRRGLLYAALGALSALGLRSGDALAQETESAASLEIQQFHAVEDLAGSMVTSGSSTLRQGKFSLGGWINYAHDPLVFVQDGEEIYRIVGGAVGIDLQAAVGLTNRIQINVDLPVTAFQVLDETNPFLTEAQVASFNDVSVRARFNIVDVNRNNVGFAIEPRLWLPTGNERNLTGGQLSAGANAIVDFHIGKAWLGFNGGYRYRLTEATFGNLHVKDQFVYRAGVGVPAKDLYFMADLYGAVGLTEQTEAEPGFADKPLEVMVGLAKTLEGGGTLTGGVGTGIMAGAGTPDFRLAVGFACCTPRTSDSDGDGIIDVEDACPTEAEDFDGFQDEDGCPDVDNDQDGILDIDDRCPNDPEDKDGFEDEDGCPDPDNDQDGILDVDDLCPNDPEDKDGFEDEDGCPDPDNDKDGIPDVKDDCPNDPEDKDGFEDKDGCPDLDNDQDGILDIDDKCPNKPENFNEYEDDDGCPDVKVTVRDIEVSDGKLKLLQKIYFEYDKATIMVQSYPILNSAIQVFKDNPDLRVRIEGHTDWDGSDDYNLKLSQDRADAVRDYLINQGGLDPSRFETVGFGESMPIESNLTEIGRALNRRIEWIILDAPAGGGVTPVPVQPIPGQDLPPEIKGQGLQGTPAPSQELPPEIKGQNLGNGGATTPPQQ